MTDDWGPRRGRRGNKQWVTVSRGVHRPLADQRPHVDLRTWQLVLPEEAAFTHLTAAALRGWWLPPLPAGLPVFACQPVHLPRARRPGLRVTRHPVPVARETLDGLRVAVPGETLLGCARDLSLLDMVVLADAALHQKSCTVADIGAAAAGRRAGAPLLRRALALADGRSESAWETLLRMLHVACGIPVEPQHEVFDGDGRFVARGDLWLVGTRVLHEYDGGEHLKRPRQRKDLRRGRAMSNVGWTRHGYTSEDLLRQGVGVLRDADLAIGRPHRPARVRAWHALLSESLFTPSGRSRLLHRLGLPLTPESGRSVADDGGRTATR